MHVYRDSNEIITQILENQQGKLSKIQEKFIRSLYSYVPYEDMEQHSSDYYIKIAINLYEYIETKKAPCNVRVYMPNIHEQGWYNGACVLEIHHDDIPFLVDSISGAFSLKGLHICQIIHPVIKIKRDSGGKVEDLLVGTEELKEGYISESVMHIQFNNSPNLDLKEIKSYIENILQNVQVAVVDWKQMLGQVENIIKNTALNLNQEERNLLHWIKDNNFTFLGYAEVTNSKISKSNILGIARLEDKDLYAELLNCISLKGKTGTKVFFSKLNYISPVHRNINLDVITVFSEQTKECFKFIGLITSAVYYQSATLIPLVREKISYVIRKSGFSKASYNQKELLSIIEAFPRDELFQISAEDLYHTALSILTIHERPKVKVFILPDISARFISCVTFIPRERFSDKICNEIKILLAHTFGGKIDRDYLHLSEARLARYHVILSAVPATLESLEISELEQQIIALTGFWKDDLRNEVIKKFGEDLGGELYKKYQESFPISYQDKCSLNFIYNDIENLELCIKDNNYRFNLVKTSQKHLYSLMIYSPNKQLPLSTLMPMLENMGFLTLDSQVYEIKREDLEVNPWIHTFRVSIKDSSVIDNFEQIKHNVEIMLDRIWSGRMKSDRYNSLVLTCGINWRDIMLVKGISKYLKQIGVNYNLDFIASVLNSYPEIVGKIVELFYFKFDLTKHDMEKASAVTSDMQRLISSVNSVAEDKILRAYIYIIQAMIRTNFFQKDAAGNYKEYVSFKFRSKDIPHIPLPIPFAEIFVYSYSMEGIHLRGGKVARGGIRWSDRLDDYRTEVLGLMKAQMAKNSIIIPVGSKGGFVVKNSKIGATREQKLEEAIVAYKTYLKGLLDITDNIVDGKVVHPKDVVRYDEEDPYLVVAADKGTATFSDYANAISKDYSHWLGDAFASGGSNGYDHKKMAITSRGAWISVTRHFEEMNIDITKQEFTAIGIGDMAGDVFGNGMLMSDNLKLVAAFNHMHIFIDPSPNAKESYQERKRLFEMKGSSWKDYNQKLLSKGGMIFERSAKILDLTKEIKDLLAIQQTRIAPNDLIKCILCADVDLLWNGGIGTYFKAKDEHPEHIGDKANDAVRVNAEDLKCKVVGEGGNLGFTQLGRIEYALKNGRINTDAIDNSAGVDCSDHEVNLKITFNQMMKAGAINESDRNKVLEDMKTEVAELVLADNKAQTLELSVELIRAADLITEHGILITILEKEGVIDRAIEYLPRDQEIEVRAKNKTGLTRPELAVLMSYAKISFYNKVISSSIPDDPFFSHYLVNYFPKQMQVRYLNYLTNHPLKREIIGTAVINNIINKLGISFTHLVLQDIGCSAEQFVRAYAATNSLLNFENIWREIESEKTVFVHYKYEALAQLQRIAQSSIVWILTNTKSASVEAIITGFSDQIAKFKMYVRKADAGILAEIFLSNVARITTYGYSKQLAEEVADARLLSISYSIIKFANTNAISIEQATDIYYFINERLQFAWLNTCVSNLVPMTYWQRVAKKSLFEELDNIKVSLCDNLLNISNTKTKADLFTDWVNIHSESISKYNSFISHLSKDSNIEIATLTIVLKRIKFLFAV